MIRSNCEIRRYNIGKCITHPRKCDKKEGGNLGLKIEKVKKSYGDKIAVKNISFEMSNPGVFGLLGTNGAGKTTIIRMILGIIKKDEGTVSWNGKEIKRENVNFGYLPEERGIYPKTKVYNQLMYFAKLKGMKKQAADEAIKYWLSRLEVEEYTNMAAEKLSKGNQQKIQFITAVMHEPELIVLDEPFSGLDPVNTELLKGVMLELIERGKYIIMSSHQMVTIEEFCSDLIILDRGKSVLQGNLSEIKNSYPSNSIEIVAKEDISSIIKEAELIMKSSKDNDYVVRIQNEEQGFKLYNMLSKNNINVIKFEILKPSLNDIFIEKVGEFK